MNGRARKRFLAFIIAMILFMEPGWGIFPGICDVRGDAQDTVSDSSLPRASMLSENDCARPQEGVPEGQGLLGEIVSGSGISGDEAFSGTVSQDMISQNIISQDMVPQDVISSDAASQDIVSGDEGLTERISGNQLSEDKALDVQVSESTESENKTAASQDEMQSASATCKVTFRPKNGTGAQSQTVVKGSKVKKPANPARSQYKFAGWYNGSEKYSFAEPVTKNLTLTAKWTKISVGTCRIEKLANPSKGVLRVYLGKVSGAKGYQIQVSTDKTFKTKTESFTAGSTEAAIGNRYRNKTYYVRARAYKLDSAGAAVYGKFSGKKSLKITKGILKVEPSATAASINSVSLISRKTVRVKAKVENYVKSADSYYYLFHLGSAEGSVAEGTKPDAKIKKATSITMKTSLDYNTVDSKLQSKFALAVKTAKPGTYTVICTPQFIANPEELASQTYAFPQASTKKGLQVNPAYLGDAVELGVKHTAYNICLDDLIATPDQKNSEQGIPFAYNGNTYWFNKGIVESIDHTLDQFRENNMLVSAILLLRWRDDISYLIPKAARAPGHSYYALNTSEVKARQHWEAVFTFLAQRYTPDRQIANWILGNEVNNYEGYHYTGSVSLANNVKLYANAYRLVYIAVRSVYANARVYISLDQVWTYLAAGSHMGKQFLEGFADQWDTYGDMGDFNIAFHPYPAPLEDPAFWTNSRELVTNTINSPCISMGNLSVLTNYVKEKWGSGVRFILSEQGFTSKRYGVEVPQLQAAAIAYAYYLAEFNSMVDAFILHRHVDHQAEEASGLYLGLWSNNGDSTTPAVMGQKKFAWDIFKYMDTSKGASKTKFALSYIGAASWKAAVPGYAASRFS